MAEAYICSLSKVQRHAEICKEINNLYEQIINFKPWYERESESENR